MALKAAEPAVRALGKEIAGARDELEASLAAWWRDEYLQLRAEYEAELDRYEADWQERCGVVPPRWNSIEELEAAIAWWQEYAAQVEIEPNRILDAGEEVQAKFEAIIRGGLARKKADVVARTDESLPPFVFRKKGQVWVVRYRGRPEFILKPSKGTAYLHLLLSKQGQGVSAAELVFTVAHMPQGFMLGDAGERTDAEALAAYQQRYSDLQRELSQAKKNNDEAATDRLQKDMVAIAKELKRSGFGGRPKRERDDRERIRKAVSNAIHRTLRQIGKHDKELAKHLKPPCLRCGAHPTYDPGEPIDWDL